MPDDFFRRPMISMSRRLWPLILLTLVLAVSAFVKTFQAEEARSHAAAVAAAVATSSSAELASDPH